MSEKLYEWKGRTCRGITLMFWKINPIRPEAGFKCGYSKSMILFLDRFLSIIALLTTLCWCNWNIPYWLPCFEKGKVYGKDTWMSWWDSVPCRDVNIVILKVDADLLVKHFNTLCYNLCKIFVVRHDRLKRCEIKFRGMLIINNANYICKICANIN